MKTLLCAAAGLLIGGLVAATAQDFPTKPLTMVVPFTSGGSTDIVARMVAEGMKSKLGQPVIIENIGGAGGSIGTGRVARADPDGYTLLLGQWSSHLGASAIYPGRSNVLEDFEPISLLTISSLWIVGRKNLPANTLQELIAYLKANPDKGSAAIVGAGAASHVCFMYFQKATGTNIQLVPYRGAAPVMQDLLSQQIDLACLEVAQTTPNVRSGLIKAFAILSEKRSAGAPDVPTTDEAGVKGLHFPFWYALWAPKGTPKPIVAKLNAAVRASFNDPVVQKRFADAGMTIAPSELQTPEGLYAMLKSEIDKWWPLIKASGVKP